MRILIDRFKLPALGMTLSIVAILSWQDVVALAGLADGGLVAQIIKVIAQAAIWLATAMMLIRFLHVFMWEGVVERRTGSPAPRLFTDLIDGLIIVSTVVIIIAFVLDKPVTGLIATSGVAVAVVGFALKSMISDLFSGIAITLERPFRMGDWIEITGGTVGKVLNLSWRATGLLLQTGVYVVIPNSRLSEMVLRVYDRPTAMWRDQIDISFSYDITAHQVERILLSAANDVPEVAAQSREASVRILEFGENGVKWRLRYWVPDYPSRSGLRYKVQRNILRNLHYSGIATAAPRLHAQILQAEPRPQINAEVGTFLGRVSLFKALAPLELAELTRSSDYRLVRAGSTVVKIGEKGDSLFVIKEGLFDVLIPDGNGGDKVVARLQSGAFFGEMSLLTGAPRGATVLAAVDSMVIEITKEGIQPILARREALLEAISGVLAERQLKNAAATAEVTSPAETQAARQTLATQLLGRMRSFFGMSSVRQVELENL